jgi:hypothetical protein
LAGWDIAAIWVADIERGPGQKVVVNLLGRAAVFEDERDRILAAWGWGRTRQVSVGLVGLERRRWVGLSGLCIGFLGSGVLRGLRIVTARGVSVSKGVSA